MSIKKSFVYQIEKKYGYNWNESHILYLHVLPSIHIFHCESKLPISNTVNEWVYDTVEKVRPYKCIKQLRS
jgi:hypothetical protein